MAVFNPPHQRVCQNGATAIITGRIRNVLVGYVAGTNGYQRCWFERDGAIVSLNEGEQEFNLS